MLMKLNPQFKVELLRHAHIIILIIICVMDSGLVNSRAPLPAHVTSCKLPSRLTHCVGYHTPGPFEPRGAPTYHPQHQQTLAYHDRHPGIPFLAIQDYQSFNFLI